MRYVIIGNSAAGVGAVEGIRQVDADGQITIISDELRHTYSRPLISYLLLGKTTREKMKYRPESFYEDNGCIMLYGKAVSIDAEGKTVEIEDLADDDGVINTPTGKTDKISYDKLLVATGSSAFVPPFEGLDTVKDKFTFMSLTDAELLDAALGDGKDDADKKKVLIIGAGLIGLKCAEGILDKAQHITVIDLAPRILSSILDEGGAKMVQNHLESKGIEFILAGSVKKFDKNTATLDSGKTLDFDILVLAVGVRPNTALLDGIAEIERGIVINEKSETSAPDIYAAGDCTQTLDISSGSNKIMALLPNAYMQGECAGINMAGGEKCFDKAIPMNAIGFCGLHLITAGDYNGEVYEEDDEETCCYKRLFYSDNKLNGYILIGSVDKAGIYTSLIREKTPLDTIDFPLICEKPGLMAFSKEDRKTKLGGEAS